MSTKVSIYITLLDFFHRMHSTLLIEHSILYWPPALQLLPSCSAQQVSRIHRCGCVGAIHPYICTYSVAPRGAAPALLSGRWSPWRRRLEVQRCGRRAGGTAAALLTHRACAGLPGIPPAGGTVWMVGFSARCRCAFVASWELCS